MLRRLQFTLRQRLWGRWTVRHGLPPPDPPTPGIDEVGYYELLLTAALGPSARSRVAQVVDVGCRNWSYLPALARSFPRADLVGVEVDGFRRHLNGYRRIDYARAHAAGCGARARVHLGDFLDLPDALFAGNGPTLVLFLFPFVSEEPCLAWGLPRDFSDYSALLARAQRLLAQKGSALLAVHQGAAEAARGRAAYNKAGFALRSRLLRASRWSSFWPSAHDSYVIYGRPPPPAAP